MFSIINQAAFLFSLQSHSSADIFFPLLKLSQLNTKKDFHLTLTRGTTAQHIYVIIIDIKKKKNPQFKGKKKKAAPKPTCFKCVLLHIRVCITRVALLCKNIIKYGLSLTFIFITQNFYLER